MAPFFITFLILVIAALIALNFQLRRETEQYQDLNERVKKEKEAILDLVDRIGKEMTQSIDLDRTLQAIIDYVAGATRAESGAIYLLDESKQMLEARVLHGMFPPLFEDEETKANKNKYLAKKVREFKFPVGEGIVGLVAEKKDPMLIIDAEADPRVPHFSCELLPVYSLVLCPLRASGKPVGVIVIVNKQGDEIFDSRDTFLLQALADQAAIMAEVVKLYDVLDQQRRLEQELEIAKEFQSMLLPREFPKVEHFEFGAFSDPALSVGGDFYDFFEVDENRLGVVIGDVSGKGIPAALIMAMVHAMLRAESRKATSPKAVLRTINEPLLSETQESVFVTMTYGLLDLTNHRFRFARAGHEPIVLRRREADEVTCRLYKPEGMAVGLFPQTVFENMEEVEIQLVPGDLLLFYTDGVTEALNAEGEQYGRDRLVSFIEKHAQRGSRDLLSLIRREIEEYTQGQPQADDITIVAFSMEDPKEPLSDGQ